MQQTEPHIKCSPILKEKKFSPRIPTVLSASPLHLHSVRLYRNKKQANIFIYIGMGTRMNDFPTQKSVISSYNKGKRTKENKRDLEYIIHKRIWFLLRFQYVHVKIEMIQTELYITKSHYASFILASHSQSPKINQQIQQIITISQRSYSCSRITKNVSRVNCWSLQAEIPSMT